MLNYHTTFLYCYILNSSRLIEIHGLILAGSQKLSPRCDCQTSAMNCHRWDMRLAILSLWEGFLSPLNKDLCSKTFYLVIMQNVLHLPIPQIWIAEIKKCDQYCNLKGGGVYLEAGHQQGRIFGPIKILCHKIFYVWNLTWAYVGVL